MSERLTHYAVRVQRWESALFKSFLVTAALFGEPLAWMFGLPSSFSLLWGHSLIIITCIKCASIYKALGKGFTTELVARTTNLPSGLSHQQWTTPALHFQGKPESQLLIQGLEQPSSVACMYDAGLRFL